MTYIYCLMCHYNKTYIGCTNDLKNRIQRYQNGYIPATEKRLPIQLIAYFAFQNSTTAFNFEKYLKSGLERTFLKKHELI